jgi:hypothetical protein
MTALGKEAEFVYTMAKYMPPHVFGIYNGTFTSATKRARFLRDVAEALDNTTSRFRPTPTRIQIVTAYDAAWRIAARRPNGFYLFAKPSLFEVKTQYAALYVREDRPAESTIRQWIASLQDGKKIPRDSSFRSVRDACGLQMRRDAGRPPGSKDRMKRKPRKDRRP